MLYTFDNESLLFKKVRTITWIKAGLLLISTSLAIGFGVTPRPVLETLTPEEKLIVVREYNEFNEEALIKKINSLNFKFPHIILAQSYQETGHYKSTIFMENNNLFGMKEAIIRTNLAKGTNRGHAYYDSWQDSLLDYALYSSTYLSKIKTEGEYFEYLKQNYAEDPTYVLRLKYLIKKHDLKNKFKK